MNIRNLKQNATVLDRNEMKSLTGGQYPICASKVEEVMIYLRGTGDENDNRQADVIQGMLESGELPVDPDC